MFPGESSVISAGISGSALALMATVWVLVKTGLAPCPPARRGRLKDILASATAGAPVPGHLRTMKEWPKYHPLLAPTPPRRITFV